MKKLKLNQSYGISPDVVENFVNIDKKWQYRAERNEKW